MVGLETIFTNFKLSLWQKLAALLIFLALLDFTGAGSWLTGIMSWSLFPARQVWVGALGGGVKFWQGISKLPKSAQRIQDLERRLAEVSASGAELETLRRENEELRFLLTNTDRGQQERTVLAAPVIAFAQPAVAVGEQEGVELGAIVLSRNILLGQITKVLAHESQVTLLTEAGSKPILAKTTGGTTGLLVGDGKKVLLTQVAKGELLTVGEQVTTVGQPQIEQNLLVGQIVSVINDPVMSVQTAVIEQAVSFFETPVVEVR